MVDRCSLKYLRSSRIDFHISTDKAFTERGPTFQNQDSKPGPVIYLPKAKETFIMQYLRPISPVIRIEKVNHARPTSSGHEPHA